MIDHEFFRGKGKVVEKEGDENASCSCSECDEKYTLAEEIYDLISDEDSTFGDILAALELAKLWVYTDYQDLHNAAPEDDDCLCPECASDKLPAPESTPELPAPSKKQKAKTSKKLKTV